MGSFLAFLSAFGVVASVVVPILIIVCVLTFVIDREADANDSG